MKNHIISYKGMKGQSLVELIFAIGVAGLVLTGAVVLILNTLGSQSKKFDHKRASDLASLVMEEVVASKNNSPLTFWVSDYELVNQPKDGYPGYNYDLSYRRLDSADEPRCRDDIINCANVRISVTWLSDSTKQVEMSRFFYRGI